MDFKAVEIKKLGEIWTAQLLQSTLSAMSCLLSPSACRHSKIKSNRGTSTKLPSAAFVSTIKCDNRWIMPSGSICQSAFVLCCSVCSQLCISPNDQGQIWQKHKQQNSLPNLGFLAIQVQWSRSQSQSVKINQSVYEWIHLSLNIFERFIF